VGEVLEKTAITLLREALIEKYGPKGDEKWATIVKEDSPESFKYFYEFIYGRELPDHAYYEWVIPIFLIRPGFAEVDKYMALYLEYWEKWDMEPPPIIFDVLGTVTEAFRGSTKTTTLTRAFALYRIGKEPSKCNLLIQVGDQIAQDNAGEIATIIQTNPGWKDVFPHVKPDPDIGWGAAGYEVKNIDMPYDEWRKLCSSDKGHDPTFVGLGYKSRAIIGKHPTGVLIIDDIHDENNTASDRELQKVKDIVRGTILPTATPNTWLSVIGTPWTSTDVLAYLKETGKFYSAVTPVQRDDVPTWNEMFHEKKIQEVLELSGDIEFARMYLCDVTAIEGVHLKREWLNIYPHEKIDAQWPVVMGVDYASTADKLLDGKRDFFTIAIGKAIPGGAGIILVDGYRGQVSQGEAEHKLKEFWGLYPRTQIIGIEAVGKGEEFYHLMLRSSRLPVKAESPGRKNKGQRFEKGMAPLFQFSRAWITDMPNKFVDNFVIEWVQWPFGEHDDCLDAVYWMLYTGMQHLQGDRFMPGTHDPVEVFKASRPKVDNPYEGIARL
jgi:hypothetical protein